MTEMRGRMCDKTTRKKARGETRREQTDRVRAECECRSVRNARGIRKRKEESPG